LHKRERHGEILTKLAQIVDAGELTVIVDQQHCGIEDVAKAHDRLASGQGLGKVVVEL
jgi:NADPH2:quinone reductase